MAKRTAFAPGRRTTASCLLAIAAVATWNAVLFSGGSSLVSSANAVMAVPVGPAVAAFGRLTPRALPSSKPAPVTLKMGFEVSGGAKPTPELGRLELDISRMVGFHTRGLTNCPVAALYSRDVDPRESCAGSRVGSGEVTSEITPPGGRAPVIVQGHLSAFYNSANGRRQILAQVVTGEPLPLVYVIPLTFGRAERPFARRSLSVSRARMRSIQGICAYPDCSDGYTLVGAYSRISRFEMTLRRVFRRTGRRHSFVVADCPGRAGASPVDFPLLGVGVEFVDGSAQSVTVDESCRPTRG